MSATQWDCFIPYTKEDVKAFTAGGPEQVVVQRVRLERDREALYTADVFLYHRGQHKQMVWQFLTISEKDDGFNIELPSVFFDIDPIWKAFLKQVLIQVLQQVQNDPKAQQSGIISVSFRVPEDIPPLQEPGENRVAPGFAWNELYIHSAKRYLFATERIKGMKVLDLGCGTGYGAKLLSRTAEKVIAADADFYVLQYGEKNYPDPYIQRVRVPYITAEQHLPFDNDSFDAVVNFEVIEHVPVEHMEAYFDEIARVLKPEGLLFISTPNKKIYINYPDPYHVSLMTLEDFRALLLSRFEKVHLYGQVRSKGLPHTSMEFEIGSDISDNDEIFIGVCQHYCGKKRKIVLPPPTVWEEYTQTKSSLTPITVIIHTRNEEKKIKDCLESVKNWAAEIIVMDMESTDRTVEIARQYTDKVFTHPFIEDFDSARNVSAQYASYEWILYLDADERMTPGLAHRISEFIQNAPEEIAGVQLPYKNYFLGKWIQYAGRWYPGYKAPMLLRRGRFKWRPRAHEGVDVQGKMMSFPADDPSLAIEHYTYDSLHHYFLKMNHYTNSEAKKLMDANPACSWQNLAEAFVRDFQFYYDITKGKQDGIHGFLLSLCAGIYRLVSWMKYVEGRIKKGQSSQISIPEDVSQFLHYMQTLTDISQPPLWWFKVWERIKREDEGNVLVIGKSDFKICEKMQDKGWQVYCGSETLKSGIFNGLSKALSLRVVPSNAFSQIKVDSLISFDGEWQKAISALKSGGSFLIGISNFPSDIKAWRRQLEADFEATVHLLDPEPRCNWFIAFGWKGQQLKNVRRHVLMITHQRALEMFGGGETQLFETLIALREYGVKADISLSLRFLPENYDLLHVFSVYHQEKLSFFRQLKQPIVISPIFEDLSEVYQITPIIKQIFNQKNETAVEQALENWKEGKIVNSQPTQIPPTFYQMQRAILETAKMWLPNAFLEARLLQETFKELNKPIRVIPNAVNAVQFINASPKPFIDRYGLRDFVLCAGRIEPKKNQLMLIWALRGTGLPLVIAGPEFDAEYAALCKRWADDNVYFIGEISPDLLASAYKAARVHALPSWFETTGLVNLEAALAGCAVVIGNRGAEREYLGKYAFVCDPGDWRSIRKTVLQAWEEHSPERAEACREYILEQYTWAHTAQATAQAYEEIFKAMEREEKDITIKWEGSQFVYHSLALINREICLQLIKKGYEISIVPYEEHQFGPEVDERFKAIEERLNKPLSKTVDVHIRHQWPPNFDPPPEGHWVIIQPWEFGFLPEDWIEPMRELVDEIWVPSKHVWKSYVKSGIPPERVFVIPNGVNLDIFNPKVQPYPLKTNKKFKFLFVGGTIKRKGVDVLLEAYTQVFNKKDDVVLVIKDMKKIYKSSFRQKIEEVESNPEAPEVLYITDELTERKMAGLYTACDCLVHPYRGEGFGLPVLEAMACGLPVIVTEGGATDDFCKKEWAYLIPAKKELAVLLGCKLVKKYAEVLEPDKKVLKSTLRYVFENYGEAQKKAKRALEHVQRYFTWEAVAEKVINRLKELKKKPIRRYVFKMKSKKSKKELYEEAEMAYKNGQEAKAIELFNEVLELDPSFALAHNDLAFIYWQKRNVDKALYHLTKAMELDPNNRDIIWNCGQIMLGLGYVQHAYDVYKSYLKKYPDEIEMKQVVEELQKAMVG